jgi:NitT/TauT family transport system ATP-binding protein
VVSAPVILNAGTLASVPVEASVPACVTDASRVEISLRKVGVSYPGGKEGTKTVLANVDLEIPSGEFVVLLGETGCGKSTLLRLMLGQEFPTTGEVIVDGKPVKRIDSRTGYVPQKYSLFPDRTVLENVMYGPENVRFSLLGRLTPGFWRFRRELREEAIHSLTRMGLRPQDMKKYPHQLSGGMQQRVAIAQALLMKPPVLLLDEAFSALDPSTRASLQELLHSIWAESHPTIVFVTHNTTEALLLGTTLIVLGRHRDEEPDKSNVIVAQQLPTAQLPFAQRCHSAEFREQHEFLERVAFAPSSMHRMQPSALEDCPS